MKTTITAALAIIAAIAGLGSSVSAQTSVNSDLSMRNYTLNGNSLQGVNYRTSQNDFSKFFPQTTPARTPIGTVSEDGTNYANYGGSSWQVGNQVELRRTITQPLSAVTSVPLANANTVVFPRADQSFDANDGLQAVYTIDGDKSAR
ncbi:MAG: hypothetical protein PUP91_02535 [Rhizonema sp. PD37]|nr:hypothetical protein [Rhizonema sp. PD37]